MLVGIFGFIASMVGDEILGKLPNLSPMSLEMLNVDDPSGVVVASLRNINHSRGNVRAFGNCRLEGYNGFKFHSFQLGGSALGDQHLVLPKASLILLLVLTLPFGKYEAGSIPSGIMAPTI